jgi:hypothetical protein
MPKKVAPIIYMVVLALHGILYGILYVPIQVIFFGLDIKAIPLWIISGIGFDITHMISNFVCGSLVMPIASVLKKAKKEMV